MINIKKKFRNYITIIPIIIILLLASFYTGSNNKSEW